MSADFALVLTGFMLSLSDGISSPTGYLAAGGYYAPMGLQAAGLTGPAATPGLAAYAAAAGPTVSQPPTAAAAGADGRLQ